MEKIATFARFLVKINPKNMDLATLQGFLTNSFSDYKRRSTPLDRAKMRTDILDLYQTHNYFVADFAHFELPDELVLLANETDETESQDLSDGTWWSLLSCWEQMLLDLDYELSNFDLEFEQKYHQPPYYFFIPVGFWSDKHTYFISCDRRYHFGAFFDCHDSYMWDKNNDLVADNLADFLKSEFPKKANHKLKK